jgi:tetratricopeptide (TPR) repeat protein
VIGKSQFINIPESASKRRLWFAVVLLLLIATVLITYFWGIEYYHFRKAKSLHDERKFDQAKIEINHCLSRSPTNPTYRILAARVEWRSKLGDAFSLGWDKAARAHLNAVTSEPHMFDSLSVENSLLDMLQGYSNKLTRIQLIKRTQKVTIDEVPILEALARHSLDSHQFQDVFDFSSQIIRRDPNHALAYFWRGLAYELTGRYRGESDEDYKKAIELEPSNITFRLRFASNLTMRKEFLEDAKQRLKQLQIETDKPEYSAQHLDTLQTLAEVNLELGENESALELAKKLVLQRPRDHNTLALYGQILVANNQLPDAERYLKSAIAISPGSHVAHFQYSRALELMGKFEDAKIELQKASQIKDNRTKLAALYLRVKERPDDPRIRYEIGVLNCLVGDQPVGTFWLKSALEIDPDFEPALRELNKLKAASK